MRSGRRLIALALAVGSMAGTVIMRQRGQRRATRVDLYFDDGEMVGIDAADPEFDRLLGLARAVLDA